MKNPNPGIYTEQNTYADFLAFLRFMVFMSTQEVHWIAMIFFFLCAKTKW